MGSCFLCRYSFGSSKRRQDSLKVCLFLRVPFSSSSGSEQETAAKRNPGWSHLHVLLHLFEHFRALAQEDWILRTDEKLSRNKSVEHRCLPNFWYGSRLMKGPRGSRQNQIWGAGYVLFQGRQIPEKSCTSPCQFLVLRVGIAFKGQKVPTRLCEDESISIWIRHKLRFPLVPFKPTPKRVRVATQKQIHPFCPFFGDPGRCWNPPRSFRSSAICMPRGRSPSRTELRAIPAWDW